ncbi:MAG: hypothetical protein QNL14_11690 [Deltaproteobacteria bacterium]|jgi:hypothetical protein|nr:hypothetical protein [Deltaproteobacteria bacterium]
MYSVMIRVGNTRKIKREVFENYADAETYFNKLCQRRTDYPASVVLTERILVIKKFRIDKDWQGERYITNE